MPAEGTKPLGQQHGSVPHYPASSNAEGKTEGTGGALMSEPLGKSPQGKSPEEPRAVDGAQALNRPEPEVRSCLLCCCLVCDLSVLMAGRLAAEQPAVRFISLRMLPSDCARVDAV